MKQLTEHVLAEITKKYNHALYIESLLTDEDMIKENYQLSIINICISYEAYISDLYDLVFQKDPRYNHPWSNTRDIAKHFDINIVDEYKKAHDAWDYYNTLKHINTQMEHQHAKLIKKYNLISDKKAATFVYQTIEILLRKIHAGL